MCYRLQCVETVGWLIILQTPSVNDTMDLVSSHLVCLSNITFILKPLLYAMT